MGVPRWALACVLALAPFALPQAPAGGAPSAGTLSGTVTDAAGRPVRGAVVEAMRQDPLDRFQPFLRTETDPEGRYRLAPIPGAVLRCWIRASAPKFVPERVAADVGSVVPLRLRAGARIRGTVTAKADGKPVAGARVSAAPSTDPPLPKEIQDLGVSSRHTWRKGGTNPVVTCETVTDAKGEFLLEQAIPGANEVSVEAPGFADWGEVVDSAGEKEVVVAANLDPPGKGTPIVGKIRSAGRPVAGARVTTFDGKKSATTDAEGRYRIDGCDALRTLRVSAPGFAGALAPEPGSSWTDESVSEYGQDFELVRALPVRGVVLDDAGTAVAGARVGWDLRGLVQGAVLDAALTGSDGTFVLAEPPPGSGGEVLAVKEDGSYGKAAVARDAEGACGPLRIRLFAPCVVRGRVLDQEGRPVAGVQVQSTWDLAIFGGNLEGIAPSTFTDGKGAYVLRLPPSTEYGLRVVEPGKWPPLAWSAPFEAPSGGEVAIDLRTGPAGPIEGVVVDGDGKPVPEVEVRAYPENWRGGRPLWIDAKTDAAGRFSIAGGLQESHRVRAVRWTGNSLFGSSFGDLGSDPVKGVLPGRKDLRLVLPRPGSIAGRIVDGEGKPVRGIAVYLCPGGKDYDGSPFGTVGGTVTVPCRIEGARLIPEPPREGARPRQVQSWDGSAERDAADRGPLGVVPYSFRVSDDQVEQDGEGRFRFKEIRWGRWRLEVDDVGAIPDSLEFEVEPGKEAHPEMRIRLRGRVTALVRNPGGEPLEGATVAVTDSKGAVVPVLVESVVLSSHGGMHHATTLGALVGELVRTDAKGATRTRYLDPGEYTVRILKDGFRPHEAPLKVVEGKEAEIAVTLEKAP